MLSMCRGMIINSCILHIENMLCGEGSRKYLRLSLNISFHTDKCISRSLTMKVSPLYRVSLCFFFSLLFLSEEISSTVSSWISNSLLTVTNIAIKKRKVTVFFSFYWGFVRLLCCCFSYAFLTASVEIFFISSLLSKKKWISIKSRFPLA